MNNDIVSGKWTEMKGKVKEAFGKLTDDDMLQIQGSTDRAVGVLQARYGYSKEQAQQEWDSFSSRQRDTAEDSAHGMMNTVKTTLNDAADGAAKMAKGVADKVEEVAKR